MKERNEKKAKILYDYLDESKLFKGTVEKASRSLMNVPFITGNADLDAKFVKEAKEAGFYITHNCIQCGACEKVCPQKCIKEYKIDQTHCLHCGLCQEKCPVGAVKRKGE